jgi:hypothetical protein
MGGHTKAFRACNIRYNPDFGDFQNGLKVSWGVELTRRRMKRHALYKENGLLRF